MNVGTERRSALLFPKQQQILGTLGENIKLARKRRQFTQKLISERTGISPVTLRKIEKGDANVAIGHYLNVLAALSLADDLGQVALKDELGRNLQDALLLGRSRKD
jgi:transcriptional regulator with XRE-family HTH domain